MMLKGLTKSDQVMHKGCRAQAESYMNPSSHVNQKEKPERCYNLM